MSIQRMTLDTAVGEVLNYLTGLDLHYVAELDRYRAITKHLNRALRLISTEQEWAFFAAVQEIGTLSKGQENIMLRASLRPRIIVDDSVRLVDSNNRILRWAYWLPRESLSKYRNRQGLWVASTRNEIQFSRPISVHEDGLRALVPVMRDPKMFVVPDTLESVEDIQNPPPLVPANGEMVQLRNFHNPEVIEEWVFVPGLPPYELENPESSIAALGMTPDSIRKQILDFPFPDLVILKAAATYAATDPVLQPRVQSLDASYKTLFYALSERDTNHTDDPYRNEFAVPIQSQRGGNPAAGPHGHPHSDERDYYNYR